MESGLTKYIQQLLLHHECVIIPGFGALISNPASSFLDLQNQKISPPYKKLAYNPALKTNDGLLAHHLAAAENLSFEDALDNIREEVTHWQEGLNEGKTISLNEIGTFNQDQNQKLIFEPDNTKNYLLVSYGLNPVEISKVARTKFIPEAVDVELPEPAMGRAKIKKHYGRVITYSLVGYLPVFLLLWYFFMFKEPFTGNTALSGMSFKQETITPVMIDKTQIREQRIEFTEATVPETEEVAEPSGAPIQSVALASEKYFIIGGSFSNYNNALEYRDQLEQNNFQSEILQADNGNFRVSYAAFADKERAYAFLLKIRESGNINVWILNQ